MPSAPPIVPDLNLATAYPEVAQLRTALDAHDWDAVRGSFAAVGGDGASLLAQAAGQHQEAYGLLTTRAADGTDPLAGTLLASWLIQAGWAARTAAPAARVSTEQADTFHGYLRRAEQLLAGVTSQEPTNVVAWELSLITARALALGADQAWTRYRQAVTHAPHHLASQAQLLQQLCPKWGGSDDQLHGFARECAAAAPAGAPNAVLVAVAHLEQWLAFDGHGAYLADPRVQQELRDAAAKSVWHSDYRRSYGWVWVHNTFAMAFSLAGDAPAAATQFAAVGHLVDEFPWCYLGDPVTAFHQHRTRSAGGAR